MAALVYSAIFEQTSKPDAINLHFALYSLPLLQILPDGVPLPSLFMALGTRN